jgi:hypothetical protein
MFSHDARVVVAEVDDENWKVVEPFTYTGVRGQVFTVPVGMETDFASVPRIFVWFLPRYGRYTLAAILHDYLWRVAAPAGVLPYADADGLFRRAMRQLGVPFLKRWAMWAAVRWVALGRPGGTKGWMRESWKVLLTTLIGAPFLVPPGALIAVALLGVYVVEWAFFVPILAGRAAARARGKTPTKKLNVPRLPWNT